MSLPLPITVAEEPPSPCVQICALDAAGICTGCLRTIDEIAAWGAAPAARKRAILDEVAKRRALREAAATGLSGHRNAP